ncbi:DUF4252 domain-containing protein [uncultured Algibacter sp.]|uniref:DUF4252 domain-containing protein n=1 Tax=uncultured Algibacter sp. TaxID=298659 RepID=UPI0026107AE6|nr:DUF4252 domain-containing protein [uncultured Algibacter sp.]
MKRIIISFSVCFLLVSCGSSFQSFYNNHKADIGTTSFQVPNFMKALLGNISPEVKNAIGNISDFKYIKFENIDTLKRQNLIAEMSAVTNSGFKDVFRKNELDNTRIISVVEFGVVVTDVIIFNSTKTETTAYYLQGNFDPEKIKSFSDEETFNTFSTNLMQAYQTNINPSFNPEN